VISDGYATISRTWQAGDEITFELPMVAQRVRASDKIAADKNRVALRYGPLVYNIEQVDQDIDGVLDPSTPVTPAWRGDLLGGVTVIKGTFASGAPLLAIPNFARYNRNPAPPPPPPPPDSAARAAALAAGTPIPRPAPPPVSSTVWIRERGGA
jgi:hypothetical protein